MIPQPIQARNCTISASNVRRTPPDAAADISLKANIAERGVLQNLIGFATPKKRGKFEITGGGRRLRLVHELIAEGHLPEDYEVPVLVLNDRSIASEISLAENFHRAAMNPADQCAAFRHVVETENATIEDVARRFGLTTRFVEGRLRLANLAEPVFDALRDGVITLDVAQAFGTTTDQARQIRVFEQLHPHNRSASYVRRMMVGDSLAGSDRVAKLVGREAYLAAGGRIERDLFSDEDELWLDGELATRLADEKMTAAAAEASGYGNVVVVLGDRPDWSQTSALNPVRPEFLEPDDEQKARVEAIKAVLASIEPSSEYTGFGNEDPDDAEGYDDDGYPVDDYGDDDEQAPSSEATSGEPDRRQALEAELRELTTRKAPLTEEVKAAATAFLVIGPDGTPKLHETVYVEPRRHASVRAEGTEKETAAVGKPLADELAVQRSHILQLHLASDAAMAIDLGVFLLAEAELTQVHSWNRTFTLAGELERRGPLDFKPSGEATDGLARFRETLDTSWASLADRGERFAAFRALDESQRSAWAGWAIARTIKPLVAGERDGELQDWLGGALGIDVASWWRPTRANFFDRVRKSVILDMFEEVGGIATRKRYENAKKGEVADAAERLCVGKLVVEPDVHAKGLRWLPPEMRFAAPAPSIDAPAPETDEPPSADVAGDGGQVEAATDTDVGSLPVADYQALKLEAEDGTLLFFRMGDFYELFFEDAATAAATLEIALTQRQQGSDTGIPMCGIPVHSCQTYLARLTEAGHRVAIAEIVESTAKAKGRKSQAAPRHAIVRVVTPATAAIETADADA